MVRVQSADEGPQLNALRWTFAVPRSWAVAAIGLLGYAVTYLLIARAIVVDGRAGFSRGAELPLLQVAPDLSPRYLLDWLNPPFVLYLTDAVAFAPSVPVLATAVLLGALVGANLAVAVETLVRRPPSCERPGPLWVAAALPSFLASFSCCAPTVLLLLGANFAVAIIAIVPFVVPVAAVLMIAGLVWSLRRLERTTLLSAS